MVALWSFILVSILLTFPLQVFPIFLALEDAWFVQNRVLFLLRRAAITACCTCNVPTLPSLNLSFAFYFLPFRYTLFDIAIYFLSLTTFSCIRCGVLGSRFICLCGGHQWIRRLCLVAFCHSLCNRPEIERACHGQPSSRCRTASSPAIFLTLTMQGSLLWWRCIIVALLGSGGGLFALKLAIQNIVGE